MSGNAEDSGFNALDSRPSYQRVRDASMRGAGFGVAAIVSRGVIQIASMAVLARLLHPTDFGLIAMGTTAISLLLIVSDCGLTMASTQRRTINTIQLSQLFWLNLAGGVLFAAVAIAISPLLVVLYGDRRVIGVIVGLSFMLLATAVGAQHEAILRRRLRYGFISAIGVASMALGVLCGIVFALLGFGYWSLVALQVFTVVTRTAFLWVGTRWRPMSPRRDANIRGLVLYGGKYVPTQLLDYCTNWIDGILIGVTGGAFELGIYRKGRNIAMMPVEQLRRPSGRMAISSLSRLQDDLGEFQRFYLYAVALLCLVALGVVGLLVAEAPTIVIVLLGPQWVGAIPILRWLSLAAVVSALGVANDWLLIPRGEVTTLLGLRIIRLVIVIVALIVGSRWGTVGVAAAYGIGSSFSIVLELIWGTARRGLRRRSVVGALARPLVAAVIAAITTLYVTTEPSLVWFLAELVLYALVFLAVYATLPGGWAVLRRALRATSELIVSKSVGIR